VANVVFDQALRDNVPSVFRQSPETAKDAVSGHGDGDVVAMGDSFMPGTIRHSRSEKLG
jgi:hypothetical protein